MNESIFIENSSSLQIKGATKVVSSTASQAVVESKDNTIVITGNNLEVRKLDLENGEVCFVGKITNVKLTALNASKTPLLKRIFK